MDQCGGEEAATHNRAVEMGGEMRWLTAPDPHGHPHRSYSRQKMSQADSHICPP